MADDAHPEAGTGVPRRADGGPPRSVDGREPAAFQAVRDLFAAVNDGDLAALVQDFDPQIVRVEPAGFPTAGTYRGIAAVQAHVGRGRATWAEGRCEIEQLLGRGDRVVAYLFAWVRLHGATAWTGGRFADGFVFRDGRITEYRSFADRADACAWAGIDADAAGDPAGGPAGGPVDHALP